MKIPLEYYQQTDTLFLSRDLLGKYLITKINGKEAGGIITETEAYLGVNDKACHAWNNRRTPRTETMYQKGGICYIYLCYGMHHLLNIVTHKENTPHAILIRAIKPEIGIDTILKRRNNKKSTNGPGTVTQALGITTQYDGISLSGNQIWIEDRGVKVRQNAIITGPRVGVDYAGDDAFLPYRFQLNE